MKLNSNDIECIIRDCGDMMLSQYAKLLRDGCEHLCPKCNGDGSITETYDVVDSWGSYYKKTSTTECSVCNGVGYTKERKIPVTKIVGYEDVEEDIEQMLLKEDK
jgi:DnaJ-class molecular chaperone